MRILKHKTNFDFIGKKHIFMGVSGALVLVSLVSMATQGMNFGVDFAGGTEIQVGFEQEVEPEAIRKAIEGLGFTQAQVQVFGPPSERQFLVRMERVSSLSPEEGERARAALEAKFAGKVQRFSFDPAAGDKMEVVLSEPVEAAQIQAALEGAGVKVSEVRPESNASGTYTLLSTDLSRKIGEGLKAAFGEDKVHVHRVEYVGAAVGKALRNDAIKSMIYAILMIVVYVGLRFDFRFAPGAIVSLMHDAIITAGFYSVTRLEFNLTTVAAILTIVGYSINDTIVIYDRIRENAHGDLKSGLTSVVNRSINETLSRTILTSGVTALSLVGLLVVGVGVIRDFAIAMLVGMLSGTYSTIYVAAPLTIWLEELRAAREKKARPPASGGKGPGEKSAKSAMGEPSTQAAR